MVLGATVVQRWFVERSGLVLGILTAAMATGQLIFLPLLASLTENHGWRSVSLTVASVLVLVIPLVALKLRDRPSDLGVLPYGAKEPPTEAPRQNPVAHALGALRRASSK